METKNNLQKTPPPLHAAPQPRQPAATDPQIAPVAETPAPPRPAASVPGEALAPGNILHSSLCTMHSTVPACRETLAPTVIDAEPVTGGTQALSTSASPQRRKCRRTGRIASLPKLQRDMVNRMISNGVPYKNIVLALDELDFNVTERNISNWATGGYLEWCLEQELVLQNRLDQDHILDHLRRDDASELPEVGLQAAATRLSQVLLLKTARAEDLETNLGNVTQMVDLLCRLNHELTALQKQRDDCRRALGRAHDPARVKNIDELSAIEHERYYSNPPSNSELAKPEAPPFLPPVPTSSFLADSDREEAEEKRSLHMAQLRAMMKSLSGKTQTPSQPSKPALPSPPPPSPASPQPASPNHGRSR